MLALAAALSLPAPAQAAPQPEPSFILIRVDGDPEFVGVPKSCESDETGSDVICLAELQDARVVVIRHLGGPPVSASTLIRSLGHHQYVDWKRGARLLVRTVPFSDNGVFGQFATYWEAERAGKFCVDVNDVAEFSNNPFGRLYAKGVRSRVRTEDRWSKGTTVVCVRGDENLAN